MEVEEVSIEKNKLYECDVCEKTHENVSPLKKQEIDKVRWELEEALKRLELENNLSADQYYDLVLESIITQHIEAHGLDASPKLKSYDTLEDDENIEYDNKLIMEEKLSSLFSPEKLQEDFSNKEQSIREEIEENVKFCRMETPSFAVKLLRWRLKSRLS